MVEDDCACAGEVNHVSVGVVRTDAEEVVVEVTACRRLVGRGGEGVEGIGPCTSEGENGEVALFFHGIDGVGSVPMLKGKEARKSGEVTS